MQCPPEPVPADALTGTLDRVNAALVVALSRAVTGSVCLISTHDEKIAARCRDDAHVHDGRMVVSARIEAQRHRISETQALFVVA